jgi:hypothetical protein
MYQSLTVCIHKVNSKKLDPRRVIIAVLYKACIYRWLLRLRDGGCAESGLSSVVGEGSLILTGTVARGIMFISAWLNI